MQVYFLYILYKIINLKKEIPTIQVTSVHPYKIDDIDERMISFKEHGYKI